MLDKSTKKKEDRMCQIAIRNAGMKQDDIARVLNVFVCFCCFTSHVNSYGHCGTVSSLNHTFPGQA